ncbi:MAG: VWA domain-containing protein [Acidobacteriota bacterium]
MPLPGNSWTRTRAALGCGLLVVASSLSSAAQAPAPPPTSIASPSFGETLDVRVVNLEAVVVDKSGNRVNGLTPADFLLRVDGKEVPIEYFTEVSGGQAVERTATAGGAPVTSGMPSLQPGTPVGTSYLVFVDDFFPVAADRNRTLDKLRSELARLSPEDRMAVVAYDGRKLDMLTTWSQSVPALERVLEKAKDRPAYGLRRITELRSADRDRQLRDQSFGNVASTLGAGTVTTQLELSDRSFAEDLAAQVSGAVDAAVATLRSFAAPPGRKVMLLLSGSWPYDPPQYVINDLTKLVSEPSIPSGDKLIRPLSDTANLLGYTVYPVDVPGLQGSGLDAEDQTVDDAATTTLNARNREQDGETTMLYIARQTGGKALLNGLRDKAFETVVGDTRSYYWLGFTPQRKGDDHRYSVKLEVRRPGLKIRSREGFLDFSRSSEVSMQVESALLFGNPPTTHPLRVELGKPLKASRSTFKLPLTIFIPLDQLTMLTIAGQTMAELELRVAALDENGRRSEVSVIPVKIAGHGNPAPGQVSRYETTLELRKAKQSLVVALYDKASGSLLSSTLEVTP